MKTIRLLLLPGLPFGYTLDRLEEVTGRGYTVRLTHCPAPAPGAISMKSSRRPWQDEGPDWKREVELSSRIPPGRLELSAMREGRDHEVRERFRVIDRGHNVILLASIALGMLLLSVRGLLALSDWAEKVLAGGVGLGVFGILGWVGRSTYLKKTAILEELNFVCPHCGTTPLPGKIGSLLKKGRCPKCNAEFDPS